MPTYTIDFIFNGETKQKKSADIAAAIQNVRPDQLHTEMYVTVRNGKTVRERKLNLVQGRKLFADEAYREIFINNLLLTQ